MTNFSIKQPGQEKKEKADKEDEPQDRTLKQCLSLLLAVPNNTKQEKRRKTRVQVVFAVGEM